MSERELLERLRGKLAVPATTLSWVYADSMADNSDPDVVRWEDIEDIIDSEIQRLREDKP